VRRRRKKKRTPAAIAGGGRLADTRPCGGRRILGTGDGFPWVRPVVRPVVAGNAATLARAHGISVTTNGALSRLFG
jgi:hypothetical protein